MTNSVYAFIQDLLAGKIEGYRAERDPDSRVETGELYELYVKYCGNEDYTPLRKRDFTMEIQRQGFRRIKVRGIYYYKGLRLIKESETLDHPDYWSFGEP